MKIIKENKVNVKELTTALKNGAVLVCPTDTVYGLVCDASNKKSVEKIFEIKKRDKLKPLAVFVKDIKMAKDYAQISLKQEKELHKSWPGATTFILKAKQIEDGPLSLLVYKNGTIGMRIPDYGLVKNIFENLDKPLAQTSANISGQLATSKIKEFLEQLGKQGAQPDIIIDAGDLPKSKPSKIIDLTNEKEEVLRY